MIQHGKSHGGREVTLQPCLPDHLVLQVLRKEAVVASMLIQEQMADVVQQR